MMPDLSHSPSNEEFEAIKARLAEQDEAVREERARWEEAESDLERVILHNPARFRKALGLQTEEELERAERQLIERARWAQGVMARAKKDRDRYE